jgi:hypothetical protein
MTYDNEPAAPARRDDGYDEGTVIWRTGDPESTRAAVWDDWGYSWISHGDGWWAREIPARRIFGLFPRYLVRRWNQLLAECGPVADQPRRP